MYIARVGYVPHFRPARVTLGQGFCNATCLMWIRYRNPELHRGRRCADLVALEHWLPLVAKWWRSGETGVWDRDFEIEKDGEEGRRQGT
jgi:hypothetical protein